MRLHPNSLSGGCSSTSTKAGIRISMGKTGMDTSDGDRFHRAQLDVEQYVDAVAQRYGFAPRDLRVRWDTTDARAAGSVHELVIQTVNGHQASSIAIEHKALIEQDRWRFVPRIEDAITSLRDQLLHT